MNSNDKTDNGNVNKINHARRRLLVVTSGLGVLGLGYAAVPFVRSMEPSARALALGAPVTVDVSKVEPGQMITVQWRGKPVWIVNRTPAMLKELERDTSLLVDPYSKVTTQQPPYIHGIYRALKKEYLVLIGICTHLGCVPKPRFRVGKPSGLGASWPGGYLCPCHGSKFDMSGRVFKNVPAPTNLVVPPYHFATPTKVVIGVSPPHEA